MVRFTQDGRRKPHLLLEPGECDIARRPSFCERTARGHATFKLSNAFAQTGRRFVHRGIVAGQRPGVERVERLPHQHRSRVHPLGRLLFDLLPFLWRQFRQSHE